jgi:hypothetical protein
VIPLSTTRIDVLRGTESSGYEEPYSGGSDPAGWDRVAENIRAVIDHPTGNLDLGGGQQNVMNYVLSADPVELRHTDRIYDQTSQRTFRITWFMAYPDHVEAGLRDVEGEV